MPRILLFAFLFLLHVGSVEGQDFSNKGKDFWVGYGYHHGMITGNEQNMVLYFTSDVAANVQVEIPALGWTKIYVVAANSVVESDAMPKTGSEDARLLTEGIYNTGIHITSNQPIVAYAHIFNSSVSGASLLFPVNTLGQDYYSLNFTQRANTDNSNSWAFAIATEDNTAVEITPSANTLTHTAGVPFIVSLNKGQIYNLMGVTNQQNGVDLTGTRIRSVSTGATGCKKIAVFSGAGRLMINCSNNIGTSDNIIQQVFPKSAWGRKYLTVPTAKLPNNYFRIAVSDPSTVVKIDGVTATNLINGFYYEILANTPKSIVCDKPVMVSQYITSTDDSNGPVCGNSFNGNGDPEMIYLSPIEQTIDRITLNSTRHYSIEYHFINVIIKSSAVNSFTLDGVSSPSSFLTHPQDPAYSYAVFSVAQGAHSLKADSGFNAIAYGYGPTESYGYNAGTNLKDFNQYISLQNQYATVTSQATCGNTPFLFSITLPYQPSALTWDFGNNANLTPNQTITNSNPSPDSSFMRDGKRLYVYKLSSTYKFTATGSYPVKIIASAPSGDGCNGQQELSYDINVITPPVANFSVTHTGCATDSAFFSDLSSGNGREILQWKWDFGNGTIDSVKNPHKIFSVSGNYNVKLTAINDVGCSADTTQPFTIAPQPIAKFGISKITCENKAITFSDSSIISSGTINKWYWDFGNGKTIVNTTKNSVTNIYDPAGLYTAALQVENNSGCKSDIARQTLTIHPLPVVNFDVAGACLPAAIAKFSNSSTISDGTASSITWVWNFNDGSATSTDKDPTHTYLKEGPYNVNLAATSTFGCTADSTKIVSNIYAQPIAAFNTTVANLCLTDSVHFIDASTVSNSSVSNWFWNFGSGKISSDQNPVVKYTDSGSYNVSLYTKSALGCTSDTAKRVITINAIPTASFTVASPTCEKQLVTITDQSTANSGVIRNWFWDFGNGTSATYQKKDPFQIREDVAGTFNIKLVVETDKGCKSDTSKQVLVIKSNPVTNFILPEVCINDAFAAFTDSSYVPGTASETLSYQWTFDDPNATVSNPDNANTQNPQHKYSSAGFYNVQLKTTSGSGCTSTTIKRLAVNGLPESTFIVVDSQYLCGNQAVNIKNTSSATVGNITKIQIAWDLQNAPETIVTDQVPVAGILYSHIYPASSSLSDFQIKLRAYSGTSCYNEKVQSIRINPSPNLSFAAIPGACFIDSNFNIVQARETSGLAGTYTFSGVGVSPDGVFNPASAGVGDANITYHYTSAAGCADSASQIFKVFPLPSISLSPQVRVLEGGSLVLNPVITGDIAKYIWTPATYLDNASVKNPQVTPASDISYQLDVETVNGCKASAEVFVSILKDLQIPNAFSPNGDGINDVWNIPSLESYPDCIVEVFNRYGKMVFTSVGYSKPWAGTYNGSVLPVGVYYFIINPKNGRNLYKGSITILR